MYSSASRSKRLRPSATSPTQASTVTSGLRKNLAADSLTRAQCRSRSGVTPSNARAPSKTEEPSQAACVRGPMMATLPACQSPSKNVHVFDHVPLADTITSSTCYYLPFLFALRRDLCHHEASLSRPAPDAETSNRVREVAHAGLRI